MVSRVKMSMTGQEKGMVMMFMNFFEYEHRGSYIMNLVGTGQWAGYFLVYIMNC